jgi:predicted histone-like DNA-binding protein
MLKVKMISKKNPKEPKAAPRFYASALHDASIDLNGLAISVASRCSLRRADVHGVLVALMDIIPDELSNGKVISLGDLGSFYVNVKSDGAETKELLTPGMVKGMKIVYRPTKELKKKLRMIDVSFAN